MLQTKKRSFTHPHIWSDADELGMVLWNDSSFGSSWDYWRRNYLWTDGKLDCSHCLGSHPLLSAGCSSHKGRESRLKPSSGCGSLMECRKEQNSGKCACTYSGCPRSGVCCECIEHHLKSRQLPGCCFPPDAERTYDRSFDHFARLVAARKV